MMKKELLNQVIEEAECFLTEHREEGYDLQMARDYLNTLDFTPQQRYIFYKYLELE